LSRSFGWTDGDGAHELRLAHVAGTNGTPFLFGGGPNRLPIEISDYHLATTPVTQALWTRVMGSNPSRRIDARAPVENVTWSGAATRDEPVRVENRLAILRAIASDRDAPEAHP
jgi:hypothetical protein